jgi:hypothetical protein
MFFVVQALYMGIGDGNHYVVEAKTEKEAETYRTRWFRNDAGESVHINLWVDQEEFATVEAAEARAAHLNAR